MGVIGRGMTFARNSGSSQHAWLAITRQGPVRGKSSRPGPAPRMAYITHAVLSGPAIERINQSDLDELVVTDTIPLSATARACKRIRQLTVAGLLAETMRRIRDEESVSSLYVD